MATRSKSQLWPDERGAESGAIVPWGYNARKLAVNIDIERSDS
jgi:hypothetical protein